MSPTQAALLRLSAPAAQADRLPHMWRVQVRMLGLAITHPWTGWAADSADATRRAAEDAALTWPGYPRVVLSVVQVGV